jgi:hypothetical protein
LKSIEDRAHGGGMSDNLKPKPLFVRLTLPANAVDVTADAAITAVIGAGRCSRPARPAANAGVDSELFQAARALVLRAQGGAAMAGEADPETHRAFARALEPRASLDDLRALVQRVLPAQ